MANWRFSIEVADTFQKAKVGYVSLQEVCREIVSELERIMPLAMLMPDVDEDEIADFIDEFREMAAEAAVDKIDFDTTLAALFDWGDTPLDDDSRMCWVNVAFPKVRKVT